jgi:H+/Cl- antiporter ClcA
MEHPPFLDGGLGTAWNVVFWIARAIAIGACAYFVYHSAIRRKRATLNIGPYWWVLFTLVGGIWTLLIYWLMEHSTLSVHRDNEAP